MTVNVCIITLLFKQQLLRTSGQEQTIRQARSSDTRQNNSRTVAALENSLPPAYDSLYQNLEPAMNNVLQMESDPPSPPIYQDYIHNLSETVIWYNNLIT